LSHPPLPPPLYPLSLHDALPIFPKDALLFGFQNPPAEVRMRMFWRIFGPSWEKAEIDYQLKIMKEAGIGGVMLFPMYPVALDDPDRKSTRLNSSHVSISYAVFCL